MTRPGAIIAAALLASACGRETPPEQSSDGEAALPAAPAAAPQPQTPSPAPPAQPAREESLAERITRVDATVARWRTAGSLAVARSAAEEARNLVVGPGGPDYGDADGDGVIAGASAAGLLPGLKGEPGLASGSASPCIKRDVLGGDWADPARRWAILDAAIANWRPANNSFPQTAEPPATDRRLGGAGARHRQPRRGARLCQPRTDSRQNLPPRGDAVRQLTKD